MQETNINIKPRIMTIKDAKVLYDLIDEAREVYMESQEEKIRIFNGDQLSSFNLILMKIIKITNPTIQQRWLLETRFYLR
jgi:hypothetical protein